jgi:uncharacterized protein YheU (UPF0270 family)
MFSSISRKGTDQETVEYHLNFARVGGLQSQGAKGEAVVGYREPLATLNLKSSGTPEG